MKTTLVSPFTQRFNQTQDQKPLKHNMGIQVSHENNPCFSVHTTFQPNSGPKTLKAQYGHSS
jgi:hypothetical protein